ncbi:hypothetical protein [Ureaplasma canigenitalium]|uniref:hypothetical protein n=1 Tax=Ureaplasma canigenitalium TaxID=42092 RepID=UPI0004E1F702|nr:hypothetical protein [Ureaplasma canigenitalium]
MNKRFYLGLKKDTVGIQAAGAIYLFGALLILAGLVLFLITGSSLLYKNLVNNFFRDFLVKNGLISSNQGNDIVNVVYISPKVEEILNSFVITPFKNEVINPSIKNISGPFLINIIGICQMVLGGILYTISSFVNFILLIRIKGRINIVNEAIYENEQNMGIKPDKDNYLKGSYIVGAIVIQSLFHIFFISTALIVVILISLWMNNLKKHGKLLEADVIKQRQKNSYQ